MDILFNSVLLINYTQCFAAKPTGLALSLTRIVRAEHAGGQTMMEKAPGGIPAILLQVH